MLDLPWYSSLVKPSFIPPPWVFVWVWAALYTLMTISAVLVIEKGIGRKEVKEALKIYAIQLALNLSWSPVFFGAHQIFLALIIIVLMIVAIVKTIKAFAKISKIASYLLYPYLVWVCIAFVFNLSVWLLNK